MLLLLWVPERTSLLFLLRVELSRWNFLCGIRFLNGTSLLSFFDWAILGGISCGWNSSGKVFPYGPSLLSFSLGGTLTSWNFLGGLRQDGFRGWKFFALPFFVGIF